MASLTYLEEIQSIFSPRSTSVKSLPSQTLVRDSNASEDLEWEIQTVLRLLKDTNKKLQLSLILPKILENPRTFAHFIKDTKYEEAIKMVKNFRFKRRTAYSREPHYWNEDIRNFVDYFMENPGIINHLPNWMGRLSDSEQYLVEVMKKIYAIAKIRFRSTAQDILSTERNIHDIYLANERAKINLANCEKRFKGKKIKFLWKSAASGARVMQLEQDLAFCKYESQQRVKREMRGANETIKQINASMSTKQRDLEEERIKAKEHYEKTLNHALRNEKDGQAERNKLQLQLQALILKYDQTMAEKVREEIELQETYDDLRTKMDEFLIEYNREEAMYNELVVKKEEERQRQLEARVAAFKLIRSVKIIQSWFRRFKKKRAQEKGEKGGKSGDKGKATDKVEKAQNPPKKGKK